MASVRSRVAADGTTTHQVRYRHGTTESSKTFATEKKAQLFADLVDDKGPDRALLLIADEQPDDRLTVAQLAEQWLTWKARPGQVTPRTLNDYRRDVANWVTPWFGHKAAETVDEREVQAWVEHMALTLSPKSVGDRHMLLHSMYAFGMARSRRLVTHNPCEETELPKAGKRRPKGTTVPAWRAIMKAAHDKNATDAEDLIRFLGTVGWRFSEAIALPVRAVDNRGDRGVYVDMTQVFRMIDNRQVLVPDEAKTYAGFRCVRVLSDDTANMLLQRVVGKAPDAYVFTNRRGNHWNQQTFLRETWPGILKDAKLWNGPHKSPTPHWLRHMAVAVLAAGGASAQDIQRYIGHGDISTTLGTYGGMLGGLSDDTVTNIDAILSGRGAAGPVVVGQVLRSDRVLEIER